MGGRCDGMYLRKVDCVGGEVYGMKVMVGGEVKMVNRKGDMDVEED